MKFYSVIETKRGKHFKINQSGVLNTLFKGGFTRYEVTPENMQFFKVQHNIAEEVNRYHMIDYIEDIIKSQPDFVEDLPKDMLLEAFYRSMNNYFSTTHLSRLRNGNPIQFHNDQINKCFLYFRNGYLEISENNMQLKNYATLDKTIYRSQILNHDFKEANPFEMKAEDTTKHKSNFVQFAQNIAKRDENRCQSLLTLTGYLLHRFFQLKRKAVIFTDERISENDEPNGRSGKTLYCKALGRVLNAAADPRKAGTYTEINGKAFRVLDKHKFEKCTLATKLICLNDIERNFPFDQLFNDISETIKVDPKNQKPFEIAAKIVITTNRTVRLNGASAQDRAIEFEFADYYSQDFSPENEFGQWFFRDWDYTQWNLFYNYMAYAIRTYLTHGLIKPKPINLMIRKIIEETCQEFFDWFTEYDFKFNTAYNKKDLYDSFIGQYDYMEHKRWFNRKQFLKWLRTYSNHHPDFKDKPSETTAQSNTIRNITFLKNTS